MNLTVKILVMLAMLCFIITSTISAVAEEPSFTNPAQAQHAANIADADFSDQDQTRAENYAEDTADKVAAETAETRADLASTDYAEKTAEEFVVKKSEEYADGVVEKNSTEYEQQASEYADGFVHEKALEHVENVCPDDSCTAQEKRDAYNSIVDRANDYGGWEQLYENELEKIIETERNAAYEYAYKRATNPDYPNAKDAAFKEAYDSVYQDNYDAAYDAYKNSDNYTKAYDEALAAGISRITGAKIEDIRRLRYEERMGWGQIKKLYDGPPGVLGVRGKHKNIVAGAEEQSSPLRLGPELDLPQPEDLSLDAEIEEVTQRSKNNGWNKNQASTRHKGNSKKWVGLTETSAAAETTISETGGGKGKSSNGKSSSSAGAGKSDKSNKSQTSLSTAGKDKNNNGKNNSAKEGRGNSGKSGKSSSNGKGNSNGNK